MDADLVDSLGQILSLSESFAIVVALIYLVAVLSRRNGSNLKIRLEFIRTHKTNGLANGSKTRAAEVSWEPGQSSSNSDNHTGDNK